MLPIRPYSSCYFFAQKLSLTSTSMWNDMRQRMNVRRRVGVLAARERTVGIAGGKEENIWEGFTGSVSILPDTKKKRLENLLPPSKRGPNCSPLKR